MRAELPVFKRCCFCLPLRYGLIAWGYFKLITVAVLTILLCLMFHHIIQMAALYRTEENRYHYDTEIIVSSVVLVLFITDLVLSSLFIFGGYKKNVKLLRVYYFYSVALWLLTVLLTSVLIGLSAQGWLRHNLSLHTWVIRIFDFAGYFVNIAIQAYFVLLLKSEITKLETKSQFTFVNKAAESECTMKLENGMVDGDIGTEHLHENDTPFREIVHL